MQSIATPLQDTLKTIYRQALDADQQLDRLSAKEQQRFAAIFTADTGFVTQEKRFMPYVEELAEEWRVLQQCSADDMAQRLPALVKKIETMLTTLHAFKLRSKHMI